MAVLSLSSFWALIPLLEAEAVDTVVNGSFSPNGGGWMGARYNGVGNGACQGGKPNVGTWDNQNGLFFSYAPNTVTQEIIISQPATVLLTYTAQNRGDNAGAIAQVNFSDSNELVTSGQWSPPTTLTEYGMSITTTQVDESILIAIYGYDNRGWAGCYGTIFKNVSLTITFSNLSNDNNSQPASEPSPVPSPTPTPTPEPSPSPTVIPLPEPSPSASPTPEPSVIPEPIPSNSPTPEPQPSPLASPEANPPTPPPLEPSPGPTPSPSPQPSPIPLPEPPLAPAPAIIEPTPAPSNPTPNPEPIQNPEEPDPVMEEIPDQPSSTETQTESDDDSEESIPDSESVDDSPLDDSPELDNQNTNPATPADSDANSSDFLSDDISDTDSQPQDPQSQPAIELNSNLPSDAPLDDEEEPTTNKNTNRLVNGGVEIFGTATQPQVIGEDGRLTPPPPPPGSGLPIDPEAITVAETFIGQPGGMALNSPDIAKEMIYEPVDLPDLLAVVPLLGSGIESLNKAYVALTNIGVDLDPLTRKKAKKIILTAIIAQQTIATTSLSLVRR